MTGRIHRLPLALWAFLLAFAYSAFAAELVEPASLAPAIESGELPAMAQRLPDTPRVIDFDKSGKAIGRYCCAMRTLLRNPKDLRMMTVYSYSRLIGFNTKFELEADILEDYTVEDNKVFTFKLRAGHKWSDGHPFTAEDFRYYWEDIALNNDLSQGGPPASMLSGGKLPVFEVLDERTVRYTWDVPNPAFLPALAGPSPLYIYQPAHYLKRFHAKYADVASLQEMIEAERVNKWTSLHVRKARQYRKENPELPTLEAWMNTTPGPSERYIFKRNPFFHRIDPTGQQLPYIDEVVILIASSDLIPAKTGTGDSELQARYIRFNDYTFLKAREEQEGFRVLLWRDGTGSKLTLYPNQNVEDPGWRAAFQDVRVRRALSLAIDRFEINQQLYFGLATESGNSILPQSPLFQPEFAKAWSQHDPELANKLLDEAGYDKRDEFGGRLLPDGRPMDIIVETFGEDTSTVDALQLMTDYWEKIGVSLFIRASQRDIVRRRLATGQAMMVMSSGLNRGVAVSMMSPEELAPVSVVQAQWPIWGQHTETLGTAGKIADAEPGKRLLGLFKQWRVSRSDEERREIWKEMLWINADQVTSIGIASGTLQPVVVSNRIQNVPEEAVWAFSPAAYFGVYQPDTFWFSE